MTELADERRLQAYIKKLRSLEAEKHFLTVKMKERHQAQLIKIMQQQQRILDHAILPMDNAIQGTFNHVQIEINKLESLHGTQHGRYCRICFEFKNMVLDVVNVRFQCVLIVQINVKIQIVISILP